MRTRDRLAAGVVAALALAITTTTATAADDFRGTWRGTWPDGQTTEITVVRFDDDGSAYGAYCHRSSRKVRHFLLDLHPIEGVTTSLDGEALRFEIGGGKWAFHVDPADPDVMKFTFRRKVTRDLDMHRTEEQTCTSRLRQLTPSDDAPNGPTVAETVPDSPGHWAIGVWTATRPSGLVVELALADVKDGHGYGLYCNLRGGPSYVVYDVHPHGLDAKVSAQTVTFRIGKVRFEFRRTDDPDVLDAVRRDSRGKRTVDAHRADQPFCASRVVARPTP